LKLCTSENRHEQSVNFTENACPNLKFLGYIVEELFIRLPPKVRCNCAEGDYNMNCAVAQLQFLTGVRKNQEPQAQNEKCPKRAYSQFASMVYPHYKFEI